MDYGDIYRKYGPLSFVIVYGQPVYDVWSREPVRLALSVVGTLLVLSCVFRALRFLWTFARPSSLQIYCHSDTGSWALVTGASDGLGYGFGEELLSRGFNVLLHGRNPEKLARVRKELAAKYPQRTVDVVVADASRYDAGYEEVADKARRLPGQLTVLVNNVGGISTRPTFRLAEDTPHTDIDEQLNINARFPTHLVSSLMPMFKKSGKPALIINCGSAAGMVGMPYITTYAGTKAYIHTWTRALQGEMVTTGVTNVQVKGFVIGNVLSASNRDVVPFFTLTSRQCAASCLDLVGGADTVVACHWKHGLQVWLSGLFPESMMQKLEGAEMRKRADKEMKGL